MNRNLKITTAHIFNKTDAKFRRISKKKLAFLLHRKCYLKSKIRFKNVSVINRNLVL